MISRRSVLFLLQGSTHFYCSQESPKGNGAVCLRERREPSHSPQRSPLYQTQVRVTLSPLMGLYEIRGKLSKALFLW